MKLPNSEMVLSWLSSQDWAKLEQYLDAKRVDEFNAVDYMAQGLVEFHHRGDAHKAIHCLEQACNLSPTDTRFTNTLSDFLVKTKRYKEACQIATKSVDLEPENPLTLHALAVSLLALQRYDKAYSVAEKALSLASGQPPQLKKSLESLLKTSHPCWRKPLIGKLFTLVRFQSKHLPFLSSMRKNRSFQHQYNLFKGASEQASLRDLQRGMKSPLETQKIEWIVEKGGEPIGMVGLVGINFNNKRAELQIGFPQAKYYGAAIEVPLLVLNFAFEVMELHKVYSYIYSDNPRAQKNSEHFGFKREGFLVDHVFDPTTKKWLSLSMNSLLRDDYFNDEKLKKFRHRFIAETSKK